MRPGEETLTPNWVYEVLNELTLASDMKVLAFLARHRLYQNSSFKTWEIAGQTGLDPRTVQASTKRLSEAGHILSQDGAHCLRGACARLAHPLHKSTRIKTRPEQRQDEEKPLPEVREEIELREEDKNTPLTPQGGEGGEGESGQGAGEEAPTPLTGLPGPSAGTGPVLAGRGADVPRRRAADHAPPVPLPDLPPALAARPGVPAAWARWLEFRRQSGLKTVAATAETHHAELQRLAAEGYDPAHVLTECVNRGWRGVFPPKTKTPDVPRNLRLDPPGDDADDQKDWLA